MLAHDALEAPIGNTAVGSFGGIAIRNPGFTSTINASEIIVGGLSSTGYMHVFTSARTVTWQQLRKIERANPVQAVLAILTLVFLAGGVVGTYLVPFPGGRLGVPIGFTIWTILTVLAARTGRVRRVS